MMTQQEAIQELALLVEHLANEMGDLLRYGIDNAAGSVLTALADIARKAHDIDQTVGNE